MVASSNVVRRKVLVPIMDGPLVGNTVAFSDGQSIPWWWFSPPQPVMEEDADGTLTRSEMTCVYTLAGTACNGELVPEYHLLTKVHAGQFVPLGIVADTKCQAGIFLQIAGAADAAMDGD